MKTEKISTQIKKRLDEKYKPTPVPSFDAYCLKWPKVSSYLKKAISPYGCKSCLSGRIIAPYERPDPVEGYKMADRIDCPNCKGTGSIPLHEVKWYWKKAKEKYKKDMAEYRAKKYNLKRYWQ